MSCPDPGWAEPNLHAEKRVKVWLRPTTQTLPSTRKGSGELGQNPCGQAGADSSPRGGKKGGREGGKEERGRGGERGGKREEREEEREFSCANQIAE